MWEDKTWPGDGKVELCFRGYGSKEKMDFSCAQSGVHQVFRIPKVWDRGKKGLTGWVRERREVEMVEGKRHFIPQKGLKLLTEEKNQFIV